MPRHLPSRGLEEENGRALGHHFLTFGSASRLEAQSVSHLAGSWANGEVLGVMSDLPRMLPWFASGQDLATNESNAAEKDSLLCESDTPKAQNAMSGLGPAFDAVNQKNGKRDTDFRNLIKRRERSRIYKELHKNNTAFAKKRFALMQRERIAKSSLGGPLEKSAPPLPVSPRVPHVRDSHKHTTGADKCTDNSNPYKDGKIQDNVSGDWRQRIVFKVQVSGS